MDKTNVDIVRTHYDEAPQMEWDRLERQPFEFELTTYMMDKYIRPGDAILDIGGGPGRYAIHYAGKGCSVTLAELSEGNVALAKAKAQEAGVELTAYAVNCLELDSLGLGMFDHVFLMGPLYHLQAEEDRVAAVEIALGHLKPGGKLYAAFLPNTSGFVYCLQHEGIITACADSPEDLRQIENVVHGEDFIGQGFTAVYSPAVSSIRPFMEKFPLRELHLFSQEGFLAPNKYQLLQRSPEELATWVELAKRCIDRPEFLTWAEHILYIGEK